MNLAKIKNLRILLFMPRLKLPYTRILITADLDQSVFDMCIKDLITILSHYRTPLTIFSPNEPGGGKRYLELKELIEFANQKEVAVEIGSHSTMHESLAHKKPYEVASIINKSITSFWAAGIPVYGFRAPYLSIEGAYRDILGKLGKNILKYDSSVLFEGNLFYSRMHDLFSRKCPHKVASVWELPLSCLDDFNLFGKLKRTNEFVASYWKRKIDINIQNHNYFLLLIHPAIIAGHLRALEDFLTYSTRKYSKECFTTCFELVKELNYLKD